MTMVERVAQRAEGERSGAAEARVAAAAQLACLLEASAPKPGNVSPGRHFVDTRYEHFLASAAAIGAPLAGAAGRPLGATIRLAVEATAQWTAANTNLGIILLLAPLARAALRESRELGSRELAELGSDPGDGCDGCQTPADPHSRLQNLRTAVGQVVENATVDDAREVYRAIRIARPGGLGEVESQDVSVEPTLTLLDVMRLAAHRDGIAREYATRFQATFEVGIPALGRARRDGLPWDDAVVEVFLTLLKAASDTHVARRGGLDLANEVSTRAAAVLDAGGVRSDAGRRALLQMDAALRSPGNTANPGTTADLTAAAIFAFLLAGGWNAAEDLP